ncbi:hypothetical protein ACIOC1_01900 [Streptomyces sp. NPDC088197]|uniref:hypothetical protein n=1 Tax=Streptomyces sp. NPDC088197 TaxID=3365840 RepID=UPI0037F46A08
MRSARALAALAISSIALSGGALALSAPMASAETGPHSEICEQAQVKTHEAQRELDRLEKLPNKTPEIRKQIATAEEILEQAQVGERDACASVTGPVHAGSGGLAGGISGTEMTAGAAVLAVAAAGGVVMMRRRSVEG